MAEHKPQGGGGSSSGPMQDRGKKRAKSYYVRSREGKRIRKDTMLTVGMRGILLTCNHGVYPCVKEAYNLLSEYADKLYGPEKDDEEEDDDEDDCDDMEASLQKEIAGMKRKRKNKQQRFQAIESGAKNVAFIKSTIDDPCHLVHHILTDIQQTKTSKSRHIMRMLPVTATYRSYLEDIERQAGKTLKPHFELEGGAPLSFSIVFKVRNCNHLKRDETITTLHRMVTDMGNHTVDLNNPDRVVLVEGVRTVACISVLTDFYKLRKYNLQTIMERDTNGEAARYDAKRRKQTKVTDEGGDVADDKIASEQIGGEKAVVSPEEKPSESSQPEDKVGDDSQQANASTDRSEEKTDSTEGKVSEDNVTHNKDTVSDRSDTVALEQSDVAMELKEAKDTVAPTNKLGEEEMEGKPSNIDKTEEDKA